MDAGVERVLKTGFASAIWEWSVTCMERKRKELGSWEVKMALDWQVLLVALVASSLQLAVLATSLQPEEQPSSRQRRDLKK